MIALYGGGFSAAYVQLLCFYYSVGAVLHFVVPAVLPVKNIQKHERPPNDVSRDAVSSLGPLAVKAGMWAIVEVMYARGWGQLYTGPIFDSAWHVAYIALCLVALDYVHDAWFYWTHRLLHWKPLYQRVHCIHHRSSVPSAFTGYSFHVVEALIVFANEVLVCFCFPIHLGLHRVYHLASTLIHEGGHAGYEMSPFLPHIANLVMTALKGVAHGFSGFNTVQHHDLHHRYPTKHFSLYFTHWDRFCGTDHPLYEKNLFSYFASRSAPLVT